MEWDSQWLSGILEVLIRTSQMFYHVLKDPTVVRLELERSQASSCNPTMFEITHAASQTFTLNL